MPGTSLGTAYVQIVPSAEGIKGSLTNLVGGEAESAGTAAGTKIGTFAKKALGKVAVGTAIVTSLKSALSEGAALQQSYMGGVDTLYGEAADGVEALTKYQELKPDLVTLDITMPNKDGIAALKDIKAFDPSALCVMCSAMGQQSMVIEAIQAGAKDFIVKPFQADRVIESIRKVLG